MVPNSTPLKRRILQAAHDSPASGHPGIARTLEKVSRYYWWPSLKADVAEHVGRCDSCQRNKPDNRPPAGPLQPLPVPSRRWGSVSMDMIVGLPTTRQGNNAILVFVDRLTKMCHLVPCKHTLTAPQCADLLVKHVFRLHGLPDGFISDRGTVFNNAFWKHMCTVLHITHKLSSAFHCQTDGQTERMNRLLQETIRHYIGSTHKQWEDHLACCEFAINDSRSETTERTPFQLNYGDHPRNPELGWAPPSRLPVAVSFTRF